MKLALLKSSPKHIFQNWCGDLLRELQCFEIGVWYNFRTCWSSFCTSCFRSWVILASHRCRSQQRRQQKLQHHQHLVRRQLGSMFLFTLHNCFHHQCQSLSCVMLVHNKVIMYAEITWQHYKFFVARDPQYVSTKFITGRFITRDFSPHHLGCESDKILHGRKKP